MVTSMETLKVFEYNALKIDWMTGAEKTTKGHGPTLEKTEWINRICFILTALVLLLALLILKKEKKKCLKFFELYQIGLLIIS